MFCGTVFVAQERDEPARIVLECLSKRGIPTRVIRNDEVATLYDVALVGWSPRKREKSGLRHGFPGNCIRIPQENRINRKAMPAGLRLCARVVYVRDRAMLQKGESLENAVGSMLQRIRETQKPLVS